MNQSKVTDYKVELSEYKVVKPFIEKWHYSHKTHGLKVKYCFGLFREGKFGLDNIIGSMIYALPAMPKPAQKYYPENPDKVFAPKSTLIPGMIFLSCKIFTKGILSLQVVDCFIVS